MLKFRDYENYRFDIWNQKIYRFRFWQSGLNQKQCECIQKEYKLANISQRELAKKYNTTQRTILRILKNEKFWIERKLVKDKDGYLTIILYHSNNKLQNYKVHKVVCELINGPCPQGMECRHLDGNKANNYPSNLIWGTKKENQADRIIHGTDTRGEKSWNSKLKSQDISVIKYLNNFCSQIEISKIYNISPSVVSSIINNKSWRDN